MPLVVKCAVDDTRCIVYASLQFDLLPNNGL
jgi:hypothetical protein